MPYYSGTANSYTDLRTALFNACVANGWALNVDILSKGAGFVQVTIFTGTSTSTQGTGIFVQGGTGASGGALTGASPSKGRMGPPHQSISPVTWPMVYAIHIFTDPDEVFLVARFDGDKYLWLSFGISDVAGLSGTGLWFGATARGGQGSASGGGIRISPTSGNIAQIGASSSGALFWASSLSDPAGAYMNCHNIHSNFDGVAWAGNSITGLTSIGSLQFFNAMDYAAPHIARSPNLWNGETALLPILGYVNRASNTTSLAVDVNNARYIRLDNHAQEDIITLGPDKWKVYPWYKKNSASRDGGTDVDHTGTLGWAIRYDGA